MAPFYGWGSTASWLQSLQGVSLLFTIQFPEIPSTHFIDLLRMKGWSELGATQYILNTGPLDLESSALTTRPYCSMRPCLWKLELGFLICLESVSALVRTKLVLACIPFGGGGLFQHLRNSLDSSLDSV